MIDPNSGKRLMFSICWSPGARGHFIRTVPRQIPKTGIAPILGTIALSLKR